MPLTVSNPFREGQLVQWMPVLVGSNYSATAQNPVILADSSVASFTVSLPSILDTVPGELFAIKNIGSNTVTVQAATGELIDGSASYSITAKNNAVILIRNLTSWFVFAISIASGAAAVGLQVLGYTTTDPNTDGIVPSTPTNDAIAVKPGNPIFTWTKPAGPWV